MVLGGLIFSSPLQLRDFLQAIPQSIAEFLEVFLVQEQLVLAVGDSPEA